MPHNTMQYHANHKNTGKYTAATTTVHYSTIIVEQLCYADATSTTQHPSQYKYNQCNAMQYDKAPPASARRSFLCLYLCIANKNNNVSCTMCVP